MINKKTLKNKNERLSIYSITDKQGKTIPFRRNHSQEHFNKNKHTRNIILKSRQLGFTTEECIDSFDDTLWKRNFNALIIAHTKEDALEIFDTKIDATWERYKKERKVLSELYDVDTARANKLKFGFGDGTFSSIQVRSSARSGTYQRVHVTEFAKLCKKYPTRANEIITGTIPAIPETGRADIESTAEGEEGIFYDMFWEAWNRGDPTSPMQFKAHFYNWTWEKDAIAKTTVIPVKDMDESSKFAEIQEKHHLSDQEISFYYSKYLSLKVKKGGNVWKFLMQEYPTTPEEAFISSGNKLYEWEILKKYQTRDGRKVGDWTYFEEYKPGHDYGAGVDVAEGVGQDSSTIVIWDFTPIKPKVVAIFKSNKIEPDNLAYEVRNGCEKYGRAIAGIERNNHGHTTIATLKGIYNNIYAEKKTDKYNDTETEKLGWHTNKATKPKMMLDLKTSVEDELVDIPSLELIIEMRTYDREDMNNTNFDEEKTKHWDLLVGAAIGYQMRTEISKSTPKNQFKQPNESFE
jgi:hypothetical protein